MKVTHYKKKVRDWEAFFGAFIVVGTYSMIIVLAQYFGDMLLAVMFILICSFGFGMAVSDEGKEIIVHSEA